MRNPRPGSRLGVCGRCFSRPSGDGGAAAEKLPDAPGRSLSGAADIVWFARLLRLTADSPPAVIRAAPGLRPFRTKGCNSWDGPRHLCVAARSGGARVFAFQPLQLPFISPEPPAQKPPPPPEEKLLGGSSLEFSR